MKIGIVTITYNLPDLTRGLFQSIESAMDTHDIKFYLFQHSLYQEIVEVCAEMVARYNTQLFPHGKNRGLSRSWNDGILEAYEKDGVDVVIIANDDIRFADDDIDKLAKRAMECRDNYMISVAGYNVAHGKRIPSQGYSAFALNPIAVEKIGMFDENIFPIYMEDCDHHRRATLLDMFEENCPDTDVYHVGSPSVNVDERIKLRNMKTQRLSGEYYVRKWGGLNEHERFDVPFNRPEFGLRIAPEDRHHPYGPFDREDIGTIYQ